MMTISICYDINQSLVFFIVDVLGSSQLEYVLLQSIYMPNLYSNVFTNSHIFAQEPAIPGFSCKLLVGKLKIMCQMGFFGRTRKIVRKFIIKTEVGNDKRMQNQSNKIIIGSYPYRGNVNICRLICEFTETSYENQFFNPCTWKAFREKNADDWLFQQLPFLIDGDTVVTQIFPMCEYVIKKSGHLELLGRSIDDAYMVDSFLWGKDLIQSILSLVVENKNNPKKLMEEMHSTWIKTIRNILLEYQNNAKSNQFYLGYISAIDFILYEVFQHYKTLFRKQMGSFPKLLAIREKVAALQKVKDFQKSDRTVRQMCPLQFYRKWKMESMKNQAQRSH